MQPSIKTDDVIEAGISSGLVLSCESFLLFWVMHRSKNRSRRRYLMIVWTFATWALTILSLVAFFVTSKSKRSWSKANILYFVAWKGVAITSITGIKIIEVLFPLRTVLLHEKTVPFIGTRWSISIFWVGLITQGIMTVLGAWVLLRYRIEVLWTVPLVSHIQVAVSAIYSILKTKCHEPISVWRLRSLAGTSILVSVTSGGISLGSLCGSFERQFVVQCLLCVIVILEKILWQDWRGRHEMGPLPVSQDMNLAENAAASDFFAAEGGDVVVRVDSKGFTHQDRPNGSGTESAH
ncbi:hypothetical protein HIM_09814 [Hirsutella minnesotensis 3608]|uniref:Uncharacterized protein n=1 Tax=Hirsutella minnesotensis 3608 TaxID=1043627 RepID=A0A0F7ZGF5_9HYPO|nr:hypothetical protein HIM_09814 [Hirsutella minnesotensis 3608]